MVHSVNVMVDELARQVKRHRDKLRHRREAHAGFASRPRREPALDLAAAARRGRSESGSPPVRAGGRLVLACP